MADFIYESLVISHLRKVSSSFVDGQQAKTHARRDETRMHNVKLVVVVLHAKIYVINLTPKNGEVKLEDYRGDAKPTCNYQVRPY